MEDPHTSEENDEANEMMIESVAQQQMEELGTPWVAVGFEPPVPLWRFSLVSKP